MINKNQFSIKNTKKVLHKVGKQWVVVSAVLLGLAAGGAAVTTANADATTTNTQAPASAAVVKPSAKSVNANSSATSSSVNASSNTSSVSAKPKMMLGDNHQSTSSFQDEIQNNLSNYVNKIANLNNNNNEAQNFKNAVAKAEYYLGKGNTSTTNANNVQNFWSSMQKDNSVKPFLRQHPNLENKISQYVSNGSLNKVYTNAYNDKSSNSKVSDILNNLSNIAGNPINNNGENNNVATALKNIADDITVDHSLNSNNEFGNNINDSNSIVGMLSNNAKSHEVQPSVDILSKPLVQQILNGLTSPKYHTAAYNALNYVKTNIYNISDLKTLWEKFNNDSSSIPFKNSSVYNLVNGVITNNNSSNNPEFQALNAAYKKAHTAPSVKNILTNLISITSTPNNNNAINTDLNSINNTISTNDRANGDLAGISGMDKVANNVEQVEVHPQLPTFAKDVVNVALDFITNHNLKGTSVDTDFEKAITDAKTALNNSNNLHDFVNNFENSSVLKSRNGKFAGLVKSDLNQLANTQSSEYKNWNGAYDIAHSNSSAADRVLSDLSDIANQPEDNNNKGENSNIDNDLSDIANLTKPGTSLANISGVSDINYSIANQDNNFAPSSSVTPSNNNGSAQQSSASQNNNGSAQSSSSTSQNTNTPYIAPGIVSLVNSASNASASNTMASSSASAPTSASATKSASSEATKHNHKVAGHYVNVPNKHVALNGVSRHAKFYMGKKAVKVSPKALKRAKVVEAVRKGHHVTYLVRVGKRAYTVRGYVKNIKPVFANRKHVEVRVGRRDYRVNTKRVHVISAVREGANVRYNVKVGRKHGVVFAKVTKRVFVRNTARRSHARKHASRYYRSMKRGHYARANENIWVHSHKNFTKRNAKFELRRGAVVHVKRLVRAAGNVTRFVVRRGFISAEKSVVRLFK